MYCASGESLCDPHRCQAHPLHHKRTFVTIPLPFFHFIQWTRRIQLGSGRLKLASTSNQLSRHVSQHRGTKEQSRTGSHRSSTLTESKTAKFPLLRLDRVLLRKRGSERECAQTHVSGEEEQPHS